MPAVEYLDVPNEPGWYWQFGKDSKGWLPLSAEYIGDYPHHLKRHPNRRYVKAVPPAPPMEKE